MTPSSRSVSSTTVVRSSCYSYPHMAGKTSPLFCLSMAYLPALLHFSIQFSLLWPITVWVTGPECQRIISQTLLWICLQVICSVWEIWVSSQPVSEEPVTSGVTRTEHCKKRLGQYWEIIYKVNKKLGHSISTEVICLVWKLGSWKCG